MSDTTIRARRARKARWCGACSRYAIAPGDVYLEGVDFPGSDLGYGTYAGHPVRLAECRRCATRYGRGHLITERENTHV